jgi:hypothetical protein
VDTLQKLIQAIASLLWPLIVVAVLFLFRPAIIALIESAKSRKFTLKIGGQELSMEEVNQQQQNLIADLQTQVSNIQRRLDLPTATSKLGVMGMTSWAMKLMGMLNIATAGNLG